MSPPDSGWWEPPRGPGGRSAAPLLQAPEDMPPPTPHRRSVAFVSCPFRNTTFRRRQTCDTIERGTESNMKLAQVSRPVPKGLKVAFSTRRHDGERHRRRRRASQREGERRGEKAKERCRGHGREARPLRGHPVR